MALPGKDEGDDAKDVPSEDRTRATLHKSAAILCTCSWTPLNFRTVGVLQRCTAVESSSVAVLSLTIKNQNQKKPKTCQQQKWHGVAHDTRISSMLYKYLTQKCLLLTIFLKKRSSLNVVNYHMSSLWRYSNWQF